MVLTRHTRRMYMSHQWQSHDEEATAAGNYFFFLKNHRFFASFAWPFFFGYFELKLNYGYTTERENRGNKRRAYTSQLQRVILGIYALVRYILLFIFHMYYI